MNDGSAARGRDYGLSEVMGFVLILGLITAAFSVYLVYGVPAQGRENEILQMGVVNDQFSMFKTSLDSLFTNNLMGTTISNSFTLGTSGGYTQGSNSIFPILSPVSSGGIFTINRRTTVPETLQITSDSYITGTGSFSANLPAQANYTPNHVYITLSGISPADLSGTGLFGVKVNTTKWAATVNLTPEVTYFTNYTSVSAGGGPSCNPTDIGPVLVNNGGTFSYWCLKSTSTSIYNGTDITLSISKGNVVMMQNYPVYKNINSGTNYTIDLMDGSYGLNTVTNPGDVINIENPPSQPLGVINATGTITYDFTEVNPYTITPIPLGAIEYSSNNNYWINQKYYYQMGGVFLSQTGWKHHV